MYMQLLYSLCLPSNSNIETYLITQYRKYTTVVR